MGTGNLAFIKLMDLAAWLLWYVVWFLWRSKYLGLGSQEICHRESKFRKNGNIWSDEESSKGDRIGVEFGGEIISHGNTQRQENWFNNSVSLDIMM